MFEGKLTWPYHLGDAAADHAVKLLRVAEEQLVEGCSPSRLPRLKLAGSSARQVELRRALDRAGVTATRCP
jgi:hypothetical protein